MTYQSRFSRMRAPGNQDCRAVQHGHTGMQEDGLRSEFRDGQVETLIQ